MKVTVIGLGAMGGGMARSLLRSPSVAEVSGFDLSPALVSEFYAATAEAGKAAAHVKQFLPAAELALGRFVTPETDAVLIVLVNESQCETVCFGGDVNLASLLRPGAAVVLSSTVTPAWSKRAHERLAAKGVRFCDCPVSGGPARARAGELTLMASGDAGALLYVNPLLRAMGREIHTVPGGAGMGSTVKMVHQLLAGVHIVAAAEALALAAKAGLDVRQVYDIVRGAAGASWMFGDRGSRMIDNPEEKVMSALAIFVKDLDIVYSEAKGLRCPVPLATVALQQFISGAGLGLEQKDDSSVVRVYESVSGVPVRQPAAAQSTRTEGDGVGDLWVLPDGSKEVILEVGDEERHRTVLSNEYTRVLKVKFGPRDTTWAHRHAEDSLYFFLVEGGLEVVNHVKGADPMCDCMEFGEVRYGTHKSDKPLVHKITNMSKGDMFCIDAEVLKTPPVTSPMPLMAQHHTLIKTRDRCRVYKLTLEPGQSTAVCYPFFYLSIVLRGSSALQTTLAVSGGDGAKAGRTLAWERSCAMGDVEWHSPAIGLTILNAGPTTYEQFIAEWR